MCKRAFRTGGLQLICLTVLLSEIVAQDFRNSDLCGPDALYVALCTLKPDQVPKDFTEFRRSLPKASKDGYSMATLQEVALKNGLDANLLRLSIDELVQFLRHNLVILRISRENSHHFVLCDRADNQSFQVFDVMHRRHTLSRHSLQSSWSGECLVLSDGPMRFDSQWGTRALTWGSIGLLLLVLGSCFTIWRRWRVCAGLLVFLVPSGGCSPSNSSTSLENSKLVLTVEGPSVVDLGPIKEGGLTTASFLLKNHSNSSISIDRLRTSCSCARATTSCNTVSPGGSCEVQLQVNPMQSAALNASVSVISGDNLVRLEAKWQYGDSLRPSLSAIPILALPVGQAVETSFALQGNEAATARVQSVIAQPAPAIEHDATLNAGIVNLRFRASELVAPGLYYGFVGVVPNDKPEAILRIPWTLRVSAPIAVFPSEVFFFPNHSSGLLHTQFIVESEDDSELDRLQVHPVPSECPSFVTKLEKLESGVRIVDCFVSELDYELLVGVRLGASSGYNRVLELRK